MYVCVCNALNDRDVENAKCNGACRAIDIHKHFDVPIQCGRCLKTIRSMLNDPPRETVR